MCAVDLRAAIAGGGEGRGGGVGGKQILAWLRPSLYVALQSNLTQTNLIQGPTSN